jgi:hypothetical protein
MEWKDEGDEMNGMYAPSPPTSPSTQVQVTWRNPQLSNKTQMNTSWRFRRGFIIQSLVNGTSQGKVNAGP